MQTFTRTHPIRRVVLVLVLVLVASLWLASAAFAQPTPEQMQQRMAAQTDTLIKKLDLTAAQDEPVRAILAAHNEKQMELRSEARASGSFGGMREKMMALQEETAMKLGEVLTEEQMTTYKKLLEEQRSRRGGRRRGM